MTVAADQAHEVPPSQSPPDHLTLELETVLAALDLDDAVSSQPDPMAADSALFDLMHQSEFQGRAWDEFAHELVRYGLKVLDSWIQTGQVFSVAAEKRILLNPSPGDLLELQTNTNLREDLVNTSVAEALIKFRTKSQAGTGWHPNGGASLTTYFTAGCVYEFANQYKKMKRLRLKDELLDPLNDMDLFELHGTVGSSLRSDDPADQAVEHDVLRRLLATVPERDRAIVFAKASGYTHSEIADMVGITPKAVERRWARLVKQLRVIGTSTDPALRRSATQSAIDANLSWNQFVVRRPKLFGRSAGDGTNIDRRS